MSWNDWLMQLSSPVHDEIPPEYPSGNITIQLMPLISLMALTEIAAVGGVKYTESLELGLRGSYSNPEVSYKGRGQNVSNTFCILSLPLQVHQPPSPSPCNSTPSAWAPLPPPPGHGPSCPSSPPNPPSRWSIPTWSWSAPLVLGSSGPASGLSSPTRPTPPFIKSPYHWGISSPCPPSLGPSYTPGPRCAPWPPACHAVEVGFVRCVLPSPNLTQRMEIRMEW